VEDSLVQRAVTFTALWKRYLQRRVLARTFRDALSTEVICPWRLCVLLARRCGRPGSFALAAFQFDRSDSHAPDQTRHDFSLAVCVALHPLATLCPTLVQSQHFFFSYYLRSVGQARRCITWSGFVQFGINQID
jgi:hypothetical protein